MKFVKGMIIGGIISAGVIMMYNDNNKGMKSDLAKLKKKILKNL